MIGGERKDSGAVRPFQDESTRPIWYNRASKPGQWERTMEHLNQQGRKDMHYQPSAIDIAGGSGSRFSGDAAFPARVAPRPGRRLGSGTRSARKPRGGAAWLALILTVGLFPAIG